MRLTVRDIHAYQALLAEGPIDFFLVFQSIKFLTINYCFLTARTGLDEIPTAA